MSAPVEIVRRAVVWVPDWPVAAAMAAQGIALDAPVAIMHGHSVAVASAAARAAGVSRGQAKRRARRACPDLVLLPVDRDRDERAFESVAAALEQVVSGVEISRPGMAVLPADGAARFHGGEESLAEELASAVAEHTDHEASVGVADGLLAAVMAAREDLIVPPGQSRAFLRDHPVDALAYAAMDAGQVSQVTEMIEVLVRLGLYRLGDLTALPYRDVLARFGAVGTWAHRLADGQDVKPPVLRRSLEDIAVSYAFETPSQGLEQLTFVASHLAQELDTALLEASSRCGRVRITAHTERGDTVERVWRTDVGSRAGAFARHMTDRVRWQMDGWLSGTSAGPERSPVTRLTLTAEDVVELGDEQAYLWGGSSGADARAHRGLEKVQALLGAEAVIQPREQGGRLPRDRVLLTAWGQEPEVARRTEHPWPGRIPDPPPATVPALEEPMQVLDAGGSEVVVDRRLRVSAPPTWVRLRLDPGHDAQHASRRHPSHRGSGERTWGPLRPVDSWAGPWPVVERWWTPAGRRGAYLQIALASEESAPTPSAVLAGFSDGRWSLEGVYD